MNEVGTFVLGMLMGGLIGIASANYCNGTLFAKSDNVKPSASFDVADDPDAELPAPDEQIVLDADLIGMKRTLCESDWFDYVGLEPACVTRYNSVVFGDSVVVREGETLTAVGQDKFDVYVKLSSPDKTCYGTGGADGMLLRASIDDFVNIDKNCEKRAVELAQARQKVIDALRGGGR